MSDDLVNIEVDGRPLQARKGQMVMQVTDVAGIYVPRFCYHEKLSIAANCRMCLVEIEKTPKPMPACATPVTEGMKVFTRSPRAIAAQKATMEFLLINHPLDCPICDQGGECELQDLALGFGSASSRFDERKRVVKDKNLGPLISTDMTRCIHCTRCVRFTAEIAGLQELGTTGRGEDMEIGTWIERSVDHELSGNVIDLCPVGALNSKPFRHRARSWEMTEHALVSPHDAVGTNLYGHVLRGRLMRVVPRHNEDINETWIADRDRYSYEGIYSADRLLAPMMRIEGRLREVSWNHALAATAEAIKAAANGDTGKIGFLGSPGSTTEELFLLGRLARGIGSHNIDTRLRQQDFADQEHDPAYPGLGLALRDIEKLDALLLAGCHIRQEAPLVAHRVRKAALAGARVSLLATVPQECHFPVTRQIVVGPADLLAEFAGLLNAAVVRSGRPAPESIAGLAASGTASEAQREVVETLTAGRSAILLGGVAMRHTRYADLRAAAAALAALTGAKLGYLPDGGNAAGAALAGALPHRLPGGRPDPQPGMHTRRMLESSLAACLLFGGIEPEHDFGAGDAARNLATCPQLIAVTPYASTSLMESAQILLPMGTFAETSGSYVNAEGRWQEFSGCARPVGEARPGWKILRVLGNLLDLDGFAYESSAEVLAELRRQIGEVAFDGRFNSRRAINAGRGGTTSELPIYCVDAIVRRATPLRLTRAGQAAG
ncbi:MAG: NADH-quinone oxidoreductase subunit NuoG [Gammaproteobacteria bacterium]|nr:NADH-quinone oxidoreductase subunit NuoG [Gammaproteobacteria bacterium]